MESDLEEPENQRSLRRHKTQQELLKTRLMIGDHMEKTSMKLLVMKRRKSSHGAKAPEEDKV